MNSEKNDFLKSICEKYSGILDKYKSSEKSEVIDYEGEEQIPGFMLSRSNSDNTSRLLDAYSCVKEFYSVYEEIIASLFFVGPIRENPKGLYSIGFEQVPKYVGPTGSNFASVLMHENKEKKYVLPYGEEEKMSLWDALNEWASHLDIASSVSVSRATSYGIKVSVSDTQNKTADIMNVGIGTSQVLPVLITGLLSEKDETMVFEQPELHLHPFSQSRLVDFFVELIKHGRKIIVETHSEAFVQRIRYHVLKENCNSDAVSINFFQNKQGTRVQLCNVSDYGNIDYPEDFRDETQELLNDLMNAALKRNNLCNVGRVKIHMYKGLVERMRQREVVPFPIPLGKVRDELIRSKIKNINMAFINVVMKNVITIDIEQCAGEQSYEIKSVSNGVIDDLKNDGAYFELITVLLQSCYNKNLTLSKRILTGFLINGRKAEDRFELICECTSNEFSNAYWFSSIEELKTEKDKAWMILNEKVEKQVRSFIAKKIWVEQNCI